MHFSLCGSAILKAVYTPGGKLQKLLPKGFAPTPCSAGPISGQQAAAAPEIQLPIFGTCPPPAGGDHWQPAPTQREPGSLPGWYFDILTVNTPSRWHSVQLVRDVNEVPQKECRKNNLMRGMTASPEKGREKTQTCAVLPSPSRSLTLTTAVCFCAAESRSLILLCQKKRKFYVHSNMDGLWKQS